MSLTVDVVSIGTLSRNRFWSETAPVRPTHATTTIIRDGATAILIDPSLPPDLLRHRLDERTGLKPEQIDLVFLTSFRPVHRRGLSLFERADWLISEAERDVMTQSLNEVLRGARPGGEDCSLEELQAELELLGRLRSAPDSITDAVDLFPSYGPSPGHASLVVKARKTVVVAGDAVLTREHFDNGRIWDHCSDPEAAKECFLELREIADVIIPGHDNLLVIG